MTTTRVRGAQIKLLTDADIAAANKDGAVGVASLRTLGTGANQAMPGNAAGGGGYTSADGSIVIASSDLIINPSWMNQLNTINGRLDYSIVGSDLQIKIVTLSGADPSPTNPVKLVFRDSVESSPLLNIFAITSAAFITIPSPARMGFKANVAGRIWVIAFNDAGTLRLGVINCYSQDVDFTTVANQIYNLSEEKKVNSDLIGVSSHLSGKFYTAGATIAGLYPRVLGFFEWNVGLVTPGTWTAPTKTQNFRTGVKLPGDIVQRATNYYAATNTGAGTIPVDATIPQIGEGTEFMMTIVGPASMANVMRVYSLCTLSNSVLQTITAAIFRGDPDAIAVTCVTPNAANSIAQLVLEFQQMADHGSNDLPYSLRLGGSAAGTTYFNRHSSQANLYNGVLFACLNVEEIQA